jgi:hypothetical protein
VTAERSEPSTRRHARPVDGAHIERPPFEVGNVLSLKHGVDSPRSWQPIAERLAASIVDDAPWLAQPAFRASVRAWAVVEAKLALVNNWLDIHGLLDDDGVPRPASMLADRLTFRAMSLRSALGLDPTSFARLLATFAGVPGDAGEDALDALRAEGHKILARRATVTPTAGLGASAVVLAVGE